MSAAAVGRDKELPDPASSDSQRSFDTNNSWSKMEGICDASEASKNKWFTAANATPAQSNITVCERGGREFFPGPTTPEEVACRFEDLQISSPLSNTTTKDNSCMDLQDPGSPISPSSCAPSIRFSPLSKYKLPPTMPTDRELYNDDLIVRFASLAMNRFESIEGQAEVVPNFEYQSKEYAENALEHHNNDPDNRVTYELIKALGSTCIFEVNGAYGHVNFTARAKQGDSEEKLFFAELHLQGDITLLTCFSCLEGKENQIGGLMELDREGKGVDLKHCYACGDEIKHHKDGTSYQAGHSIGRRSYECP